MSRVTRMIGWVGLAGFGAGVGVGLAAPIAVEALGGAPVENPDQQFINDFLNRFRAEYGLRGSQAHDLRAILLQFCYDKMRIVTNAGYQQWPLELQSQLVQAQRQLDKRIEFILDPEQRARYRRETATQTTK